MAEGIPEAKASEQELVKKFAAREIGLADLPQDLANRLLKGSYEPTEEQAQPAAVPTETDQVPNPEPVPTAPAEEPKQVEEGKVEPPKEPRKKKSIDDLRDLALKRADKINAMEQAEQSRLHKLQTDPIFREKWFRENGIPVQAAPQAKPDIWDDNFHLAQAKSVAEMKSELDAMKAQRAAATLIGELEKFAGKQGFKFSAPLAELDRAYDLLDKANRKEPTAEELVGLGFDEDDVKMHGVLLQVRKKQVEERYPTFDSAFYDWQRLNGGAIPKSSSEQAAPDAESADREARKKKMAEVLSHTTTIPSQQATASDGALTPEFALKWLSEHRRPAEYSEEERSLFHRIQAMQGMRK